MSKFCSDNTTSSPGLSSVFVISLKELKPSKVIFKLDPVVTKQPAAKLLSHRNLDIMVK